MFPTSTPCRYLLIQLWQCIYYVIYYAVCIYIHIICILYTCLHWLYLRLQAHKSPHLLHLCFVLINQSRPAKPLIGAMLDGVRKDFKRCDRFPEVETCWSSSMFIDLFGYKQNMWISWSSLIHETMIRDDIPWWDCMIWIYLKKTRVLCCWCPWFSIIKYVRARLGAQTVKELHEDLYTMKTRWGPWFSNGGCETGKMQLKYILSKITSSVWDMNYRL